VLHISGAAQRLTQTHANYTGWATKRAEQQAAYAKVCAARAAEAEKLQTYADHGFKVLRVERCLVLITVVIGAACPVLEAS